MKKSRKRRRLRKPRMNMGRKRNNDRSEKSKTVGGSNLKDWAK
jgi:hypothetical protein